MWIVCESDASGMEEKGVRGAKQRAAAGVGEWLTAPHANVGKEGGPEAQQSKISSH